MQFIVTCKELDLTRNILIEADSKLDAMAIAEEKYGVMPIRAKTIKGSLLKKIEKTKNLKLKFKDILFIFQEIYILISSGISLKDALVEVKTSSEEIYVERILDFIIAGLNQGKTFSSLISKYYQQDSLVVYILQVGEKGGDLDKALHVIISYLEDTDKNISSVVKALSYPIILIIFTFMALVMLLTFVIPQFEEIFKSFGNDLPVYTKALLSLSHFLRDYGLMVLVGILSTIVLFFLRYKTNSRFKLKIDEFIMTKIFIVSKILSLSTMFKISSSLEVLLSAGVNVAEALTLLLSSMKNMYIRSKIEFIIYQIKNGKTLANALRASGLFKNSTIRLIFAGENSGQTPEMLQKVAKIHRRELNSYIDTVAKLIEPFLLVFISIIVLFIALSIFMPIWSLSSGI